MWLLRGCRRVCFAYDSTIDTPKYGATIGQTNMRNIDESINEYFSIQTTSERDDNISVIEAIQVTKFKVLFEAIEFVFDATAYGSVWGAMQYIYNMEFAWFNHVFTHVSLPRTADICILSIRFRTCSSPRQPIVVFRVKCLALDTVAGLNDWSMYAHVVMRSVCPIFQCKIALVRWSRVTLKNLRTECSMCQ